MKITLTQEERKVNELFRKMWWDIQELNLIDEGIVVPNNLEERVRWITENFEKTAAKAKKFFRPDAMPVIFERTKREPIVVLREIKLEDGKLKVEVEGKKIVVEMTEFTDANDIVTLPVFVALEIED